MPPAAHASSIGGLSQFRVSFYEVAYTAAREDVPCLNLRS